jgi:DNA-binding MarR family transcriptional regulator
MMDRSSPPSAKNPFYDHGFTEEPVGGSQEANDTSGDETAPVPTVTLRTTTDGIAAPTYTGPRAYTKKQAFNHLRHKWLALVARDRKMTGAALRVAILIWEHQNVERGYAWPSLDYLARELNVFRSTITRAIKLLEKRGWITVERQGGCHRSNRYRLAFGNMDD